jgi:hypothetical protein
MVAPRRQSIHVRVADNISWQPNTVDFDQVTLMDWRPGAAIALSRRQYAESDVSFGPD